MSEILQAVSRAARDLLHPKMLWLVAWPLGVSLLVWLLLAVVFGDDAVAWLSTTLEGSAIGRWMSAWLPVGAVVTGLGWVLLVVLLVPLVLATASVIIGIFSMPAMVEHVAGRSYPDLQHRRGGTIAGSIWNAVVGVAFFVGLGLVSLPLWLVPPLWPFLAALLMGLLNQRMFRYDALAEHAAADEMRELFRRHRREFFGLGVLVSLLSYVPFAGLVVPVAAGLAFIHYGLARLAGLRRAAAAG
ncbi:MAG: EI24 domain-containing protein [Burkholderiales bacterium]|nr:EI24 domain-containing protein [Burkholderiales bacterium]